MFRTIAIVEAPKTAIIATGYFPEYTWLAIGGASYLNNIYRIMPLVGQSITLFPDQGQYDQWLLKAKSYSHLANFTVSDLLERKNAKKGSDIADYLTMQKFN